MSLQLYLAYVAACFVFAIVPGPIVTLVVANSLRHGAKPGLANIAGAQLGLAVMIAIVAIGLASIIATMGWWFDWLRLIGAAYLIWIGVKMFRSSGLLGAPGAAPKPRGGFFWQGFLVLMSNPKALFFFGAFIPQFIDPRGNYVTQVVVLGLTVMAVTMMCDSVYVLLTTRAAALLSQARVRLVSRLSGLCLIGGGVWLALARSR
jgi:threonine/homoserine/homoserine lactone efflux protein